MASPLPISFADFLKDPFKATMFLIIISVGYLYVDNKLMYQDQISKSDAKIEIMDYSICVSFRLDYFIHKQTHSKVQY
jgi:hypothetical protein